VELARFAQRATARLNDDASYILERLLWSAIFDYGDATAVAQSHRYPPMDAILSS
jgi:hypothetical protein